MKRIRGNAHEVCNLYQSLIAIITASSGKERNQKTRMS